MHSRNVGWNAYLIAALANLSMFLLAEPVAAETWSDASGKFTIQAEYAGIDGKNLVLVKSDGSRLSVPISKLSAESRAQAKTIYERQKSPTAASPVAEPSMPRASSSTGLSKYQPAPRALNFTPPTPPRISPMQAYPSDVSLEESLAYVRDQAMAGHLEVFWHALPTEMQAVADSPELRDAMRAQIKENGEMSKQIVSIVDKLTEVLATKKQFILNSPMLAQVPPEFKPFIEQGFDPAVGLIHEYADMVARTDTMMEVPLGDYVDYHFSRIGAHAQALLKVVPAEIRDPFVNSFVAAQTSETEGTISFSKQDGTTQTVQMTRYNGRWLPSDLVTKWQSDKESMIEQTVASVNNSEMSSNNDPQAKAGMEAAVAQAGVMLAPLLAANSQEEFDTAVGQVMRPVMMMMGGAMGGGAPNPGAPEELQPEF